MNILSIFSKIVKRDNKICEASGHDMRGCKCKRCGKYIHEWEQTSVNERQVYIYPGYPRKQTQYMYNCVKCDKKVREYGYSKSSR